AVQLVCRITSRFSNRLGHACRRKTCLVSQTTFWTVSGIRRTHLDVFWRNRSALVRNVAHSIMRLRGSTLRTGRKVTSERTTFTTAGFASAKGFGGYGNCLTSQAAFTYGHVDRAKAKRIMRARKSPRASEQVSFDLYRGGRGTRVQRLRAGAASTRD